MVDTDVGGWQGRTMIDRDGGYIGTIKAIYVDHRSGQPQWALVSLGVAGTSSTFVPIAEAVTSSGEDIRVPYQKQFVKDAPDVDPDRPLTAAEELQLLRHYGLEDAGRAATPARGPRATVDVDDVAEPTGDGEDTTEPAATAERDAVQPAAGGAGDDAMTRSEEEVRVRKETRERGRVRLRKYVTTDEVQLTVPVRREKVGLEWEPTATDQQQVSGQVRKEQLDLDQDG